VDRKLIQYADFKNLLNLRSDNELTGLIVKFDGVWVNPPDGNFFFPEERNFLCRHPRGTHMIEKEPALAFPCSIKEFQGFISFFVLDNLFCEERLEILVQKDEELPQEAKERYLKVKEMNRWAEELLRQNEEQIRQDEILNNHEEDKYAGFLRQEEKAKETPEGFRDQLLRRSRLTVPDLEIKAAVLTKYLDLSHNQVGKIFPAVPGVLPPGAGSVRKHGERVLESVMRYLGAEASEKIWPEKMTEARRKRLFPKKLKRKKTRQYE
jgi:hypothetical protein